MLFYPDQRHLLELTTIRRERVLPEEISGTVEAGEGSTVNLRDMVARATPPSRYVMVRAAEFFRLKNPDALNDLLQVELGSYVDEESALATHRNRKLLAPVAGIVAYIGDG